MKNEINKIEGWGDTYTKEDSLSNQLRQANSIIQKLVEAWNRSGPFVRTSSLDNQQEIDEDNSVFESIK